MQQRGHFSFGLTHPDREKFLTQFLAILNRHKENLGMESASESVVQAKLLGLDDDELQQVLIGKEWGNLNYGYRERVTDRESIAELP